MAVKKGDKIKVEYTGTFEDGEVFDSSEKHGQPLEFEAGAGMVVKGFDAAVEGMEEGEEKEITIEPSEGYGDRNEELIKRFPKDQLPSDKEVEKGMMLVMETPEGQKVPAMIAEVTDTEVAIDLNHPLAGKVLKFKIKIVGIES